MDAARAFRELICTKNIHIAYIYIYIYNIWWVRMAAIEFCYIFFLFWCGWEWERRLRLVFHQGMDMPAYYIMVILSTRCVCVCKASVCSQVWKHLMLQHLIQSSSRWRFSHIYTFSMCTNMRCGKYGCLPSSTTSHSLSLLVYTLHIWLRSSSNRALPQHTMDSVCVHSQTAHQHCTSISRETKCKLTGS